MFYVLLPNPLVSYEQGQIQNAQARLDWNTVRVATEQNSKAPVSIEFSIRQKGGLSCEEYRFEELLTFLSLTKIYVCK